MGFSKHRTPTANGMSFRRCLSGGGDIFSKSVERQGGANRTFATGGCCHGWQLEPCPYGLEPLLTFRQKIPTGKSSPNLCVHSSSSYVSPSMLPLSSGDLIEWSLVCHSTLSYQKFCDRHSNHYDHPEELHQSVE